MGKKKTLSWPFYGWMVTSFALILVAGLVLTGCAPKLIEIPPPIEGPTTFIGAEYVGAEKCKDCHREIYDGWKTTLHPKKIQPADEFTVIGDFVINNKLTVKVTAKAPKLAGKEITTTMYKKDDKFYVNTIGPDWEFHDYEITSVIGTAWKQRYMTEFPNGALHVLPVQWNVVTKEWVDYQGLKEQYPGDGKYWSDLGRIWQLKCGSCHVTGLEINYDPAKDTFDSTWADLGVACEACHGPGSKHVEAATEFFEYELETIVNPANLPWQVGGMVCGQCHARGESIAEVSPYKEGFPKNYGYPFGYLPGKTLYLYYIEKPGLWPDGSAKSHHQQYTDWTKSGHAKSGVMCWNCHTVHEKGPTREVKLPGSLLCISCHSEPRETTGFGGLTHTIHDFGSCLDCHMPYSAKTAVSGDIRSHTFSPIKPQATIDVLVKKAMEKDKYVLDWFGLKPADVEGLSKAAVNDLLKAKWVHKDATDLLLKTQVNTCNLCHDKDSPWSLQEKISYPRPTTPH